MNTFWDYAIAFGVFAALQIAWTLLVRTFPDFLGSALLKGIELRNSMEIEQLKDDLTRETQREIERLRADYATLKSSTDYLSANQTELRSRMIAATDRMWNSMLGIRKSFGDVMFIDTIALPKELEDAFANGSWPKLLAPLYDYRDERHVTMKIMENNVDDLAKDRLFIGDRLWLIYYVFSGVHFRMGLLLHRSFATGKYNGWRDDDGIRQLLNAVLSEALVKPAFSRELSMMPNIIATLEAEFLKEGMRIMSGSKFFADSITDMQSTLRYELEVARSATESRK
jgi:hypothetical protein